METANSRVAGIAAVKEKIAKINPTAYKSNVFTVGSYMINGVYVGAFLATATALLISWTIRIISNKGYLPALKHWRFWLFNLVAVCGMFLANIELDKWHGFNVSWVIKKIPFSN